MNIGINRFAAGKKNNSGCVHIQPLVHAKVWIGERFFVKAAQSWKKVIVIIAYQALGWNAGFFTVADKPIVLENDKAKVDNDTESYTDSELDRGATYHYRVRSYNEGADSDASNSAEATTTDEGFSWCFVGSVYYVSY